MTLRSRISPRKHSAVAGSSLRALHTKLIQAETSRRAGELDKAERICRSLLEEHPTHLGALQTFGLVALEKKNYPQAVTCFLTAAAEAPSDWTNFTNLGAAWLGLELPHMAVVMLREARSLNPQDPEIHFMLGEVFAEDREYEDAMAAYREALALEPNHKLALFKLSDCYINLGFFHEARDLLLRLRKLRPDAIAVVNLLFQLPKGMVDLDFKKAVDRCEKQDSETRQDYENSKAFVRAAILDREGDYEAAWNAIKPANAAVYPEHTKALKPVLDRRARELEAARSLKASSLGKSSGKAKRDAPVPLFIQGVSRSGKTTLETLIDCHPDIKRGYENHAVEFATVRASQTAGLVSIRSLNTLPDPLLPSFAQHFRDKLASSSSGNTVITNTNPGLIGAIGRVAQALPEARFVFLTRNRDDAALRIFMKKYKSGNHHAYDMATAYQYIDWYEAMIEALTGKLGERAIHIRYEDTVANPSAAVRSVFDLCRLASTSLDLPMIGTDVDAAKPYANFLQVR